jgi:tyrosyl-tRNA synthetase
VPETECTLEPVVSVLVAAGLADTRSSARRLIEQGGVRVNGERVVDVHAKIAAVVGERALVQVGKRRVVRIVWK